MRPPQRAQIFVLAIKYAGMDVLAGLGGSRRPLVELAYEICSRLMSAHLDLPPRVAFADPERGWPTTPRLARCVRCTLAIAEVLRMLVAELVSTAVGRMSGWFADLNRGLLVFVCLTVPR